MIKNYFLECRSLLAQEIEQQVCFELAYFKLKTLPQTGQIFSRFFVRFLSAQSREQHSLSGFVTGTWNSLPQTGQTLILAGSGLPAISRSFFRRNFAPQEREQQTIFEFFNTVNIFPQYSQTRSSYKLGFLARYS